MKNDDRVLLVDTDVLCYQIAFSNQDDVDWDDDGETDNYVNEEKAIVQTAAFIEELMDKLRGTSMVLVLSDEHANFRKELDPTYKANRTKPKPVLWRMIRDYIEWGDHGWPVIDKPRLEGDDVLGILHTSPKYRNRSIVVSIDKDMRTVPGRLFLWNREDEGIQDITARDAAYFHLRQVLEGDQVDNYPGCYLIGEKKADDIVESANSPAELWNTICETYEIQNEKAEAKGKEPRDPLHQARLAHILQYGDTKEGKVRLWKPTRLRSL